MGKEAVDVGLVVPSLEGMAPPPLVSGGGTPEEMLEARKERC